MKLLTPCNLLLLNSPKLYQADAYRFQKDGTKKIMMYMCIVVIGFSN